MKRLNIIADGPLTPKNRRTYVMTDAFWNHAVKVICDVPDYAVLENLYPNIIDGSGYKNKAPAGLVSVHIIVTFLKDAVLENDELSLISKIIHQLMSQENAALDFELKVRALGYNKHVKYLGDDRAT